MSFSLERGDLAILNALQDDADKPMAEIAELAGLSLSTCWRRVKLLKEAGIIRKTVALIDARAAGLSFAVETSVTLKEHGQKNRRQFEEFAERRPEIMECRHLTGQRDYQLRIVTPDLAAYEHFLTSVLLEQPSVSAVVSNIVLREVKATTALPLDLLRRS
ncbi:Lrp/AsnC family transcriptional regulator [Govanella unica]|uniref:Lrp/AsnC family transcriptional regulator n=1 Tax=Govanella unica TaxID=2975056 RepID=A0A9X3Z7J5_9PROT|nr:Lrp/AsnC family transcriptional regulator [Govania unica]MDA5194044.1 Lrp/AsnC family transcriptional regulator [Govania unica]